MPFLRIDATCHDLVDDAPRIKSSFSSCDPSLLIAQHAQRNCLQLASKRDSCIFSFQKYTKHQHSTPSSLLNTGQPYSPLNNLNTTEQSYSQPEQTLSPHNFTCARLPLAPTMLSLILPVAILVLSASHTTSDPLPAIISTGQKFTLKQVAVPSNKTWAHRIRSDYIKYGRKPPAHIEEAVARREGPEANTTSVNASSLHGDLEYSIVAKVGNVNVTLNLDTGSADLYVLSIPIASLKLTPTDGSSRTCYRLNGLSAIVYLTIQKEQERGH